MVNGALVKIIGAFTETTAGDKQANNTTEQANNTTAAKQSKFGSLSSAQQMHAVAALDMMQGILDVPGVKKLMNGNSGSRGLEDMLCGQVRHCI